MNLRIKSFALTAALALSLTLTGGIASAQSASSTTHAELKENPTAVGCTIAITSGDSIDFGDFTWNGTGYSGTTGAGTISLTRSDDRAPGKAACDPVQVHGTGLSSSTTGDTAFAVSAITLNGQTLTGTDTAFATSMSMGPNTITVALDSSAVNNSAAPASDYTGSITFTQATGL